MYITLYPKIPLYYFMAILSITDKCTNHTCCACPAFLPVLSCALLCCQRWEGPQVSGKDFYDLGGEECVS